MNLRLLTLLIAICPVVFLTAHTGAGSRADVLLELNNSASTNGTEEVKSWKLFFDATLEITEPPLPLSETFNMNTVWVGMEGWEEVSNWAQENEHMGVAFLESSRPR